MADYYIVGSAGLATIAAAAALAVDTDIIVVPAGSYTEDVTLAYGVTLRAVAGATVNLTGKLSLNGGNKIRGLTLFKGASDYTIDTTLGGGTVWFEQCTIHPKGTYGTFATPMLGTVTFNRCLFTDVGITSPTYFLRDNAGYADSVVFYSNVFTLMNTATSGGFLFTDPVVLDVTNNTFIMQNDGDFYQAIRTSPGVNGTTRKIRRNILVRLSGDTGGILLVDQINVAYTVQYNRSYGYAAGAPGTEAIRYNAGHLIITPDSTNSSSSDFTLANLADVVNGVPGPRPCNTPAVNRAVGVPDVDFNGTRFADQITFGAIQNQGDNSSIYRPWFNMDLLTGFTLKYSPDADPASAEPSTLAPDASMLVAQDFYSPYEVAAVCNAYIQDVMGPGGGAFFVDYTGNYRLVAYVGNFCLTLTGDAATIFGSLTFTNDTDTG